MLEMRGTRPIDADHGPAVRHRPGAGHADVHHRLNSDRQAWLPPYSPFRLAVIRNLRVLMESYADAVADQIAHNAEASRLHDSLHRCTDVADMILRRGRLDSSRERLLRHVEELL